MMDWQYNEHEIYSAILKISNTPKAFIKIV